MPLEVRPIALSVAVICFFVVVIIGSVSGLCPFTCCKRGLAGAVVAYIGTACSVKAINAILINAMAKKQMNELRENLGDNKD